MKLLKYSFLSITVGVLLSIVSCTDLEETVYTEFTNETIDLSDPDVIDAMMGETYANFRFIYWNWEGYFDLNEECTDTYMTPKRPNGWGAQYIQMHKHTWNAAYSSHLDVLWTFGYRTVCYANSSLDILPDTGLYQAEMRFLRATSYYMLMDAFREVPLETTQIHDGGYLPTQATADSIFNFCVSELQAIKDDLGTDRDFGFPNRYAACMTLAKLYLNYNTYFDKTDNSYYQKALDEVNEVINEGGYSLAPHYLDNFKEDISGSPEVIFAIPLDASHARHNYLSNKCLPASGCAAFGYTAAGGGWNGSCAVPQFIDSYDANDKRLGYTWTGGVQHFYNEEEGIPNDPNGTPISFSSDDWSGTGYLNYSKRVHSIDNPMAYTQEGYRFIKSEIVPGTVGTYGNDVAFFRLADAMFIKAECLLRLGQDEQVAADLITEVRTRSFDNVADATRTIEDLKGGSVYPYGHQEYTSEGYNNWGTYVSTDEEGDDIIFGGLLDDLAWEFVGEHHRRQDLIRFKMTDGRNVFNGKSWFCKDATTETKYNYFPIPKMALDANMNLKQHEAYDGTGE
ncbi:MAG: RagB/SusD family nutrient uptake outer membrane protein [Salinivirgaceae bacterium]|nr:RagB/SusD family nutrient uptake outer membrane protein [Salinivirgaceae bacterium]